jgi:hypothetical protein
MGRGICGWSIFVVLVLGATDAHARHGRVKAVVVPAATEDPSSPMFEEEAAPAIEPARHDPEILGQSEMLSLAKKYAGDIAASLIDGERHREEAVRQRDSIKLACIQDRLSAMKLMKKLSDDRLDATMRPSIRADELNLRHEFRGVEMAHQRVLELQRELSECAGENLDVGGTAEGSPTPASPTGAVDPGGGTAVEVPPADRPVPASMYK